GISDEFRSRDAVRIELRQAIHGVAQMRFVRYGQLVPRGERRRRGEAKCTAQIDHPQTRVEQLWPNLRRDFVRRGEKSRARGICRNRFDGKGPQRRLAPTAQLGKKLGKALCTCGIANIKRWPGNHGMTQEEGGQLITRIAGDTNDGDVPGISHFTCASIFFCKDSRALWLGVMIRTVSSPAMVPAISGNLAPSTAAARGCAPLGGVLRTRRFCAGRRSSRNSRSARVSGGTVAASSGRPEPDL